MDHVLEPSIPIKSGTAAVSLSSVQALVSVQAQAYCGPAHGYRWELDPDTVAPLIADVTSPGLGAASYRLILNPRTRRPAHDHQGRLLYWYVSSPRVADPGLGGVPVPGTPGTARAAAEDGAAQVGRGGPVPGAPGRTSIVPPRGGSGVVG